MIIFENIVAEQFSIFQMFFIEKRLYYIYENTKSQKPDKFHNWQFQFFQFMNFKNFFMEKKAILYI